MILYKENILVEHLLFKEIDRIKIKIISLSILLCLYRNLFHLDYLNHLCAGLSMIMIMVKWICCLVGFGVGVVWLFVEVEVEAEVEVEVGVQVGVQAVVELEVKVKVGIGGYLKGSIGFIWVKVQVRAKGLVIQLVLD